MLNKLSGLLRRTGQNADISISSPHPPGSTPKVMTPDDVSFHANRVTPSFHGLRGVSVSVPSGKASKKAEKSEKAGREPFCTMKALEHAPRLLEKMAALCAASAPEHATTLNAARDGIFLIAAAHEMLRHYRDTHGNAPWDKLDFSNARAVASLQDAYYYVAPPMKKAHDVSLSSLTDYEAGAQGAASHFAIHLALSIAYDQGATISAAEVKSLLGIPWSPQSADDILIRTFGPIGVGAKASWLKTLDILANPERFGSSPGAQNNARSPGASSSSSSQMPTTVTAPPNADQKFEADYQAALNHIKLLVAKIIGVHPPDPKESKGEEWKQFFHIPADATREAVVTDIKKQFRAVTLAIHPDKHPELIATPESPEAKALLNMYQSYTVAFEQAKAKATGTVLDSI